MCIRHDPLALRSQFIRICMVREQAICKSHSAKMETPTQIATATKRVWRVGIAPQLKNRCKLVKTIQGTSDFDNKYKRRAKNSYF